MSNTQVPQTPQVLQVQQTSTIYEKMVIATITSFFSTITVGLTIGLPLWMELIKAETERARNTITVVETTLKAQAAVMDAREAVSSNEDILRDLTEIINKSIENK